MTIEHDPTLAVTCHAVASHEEVQKATAALEAMYNEYHENGGISPDTRDEARCVARALGLPEDWAALPPEPVLELIYGVSSYGVDLAVIAMCHLAALSA